jgi:hypothetical protein
MTLRRGELTWPERLALLAAFGLCVWFTIVGI